MEEGQTSEAGDHRVILGEVRAYGDPSPAFGPLDLGALARVIQLSTASGNAASLAIDGHPGTYSETLDEIDSYWLLELDQARPIQRVELVNRSSSAHARPNGGIDLAHFR